MKNNFSFRRTPNVFTTVSRHCNGATLILLFALCFGFSSQAWGRTIYLDEKGQWDKDDATIYITTWDGNIATIQMTKLSGSVWYANIDNAASSFNFLRKDKSGGSQWGYTGNQSLTSMGTNNMYILTDYTDGYSNGYWSTMIPIYGGTFYFDDSKTGWGTATLLVGKDDYTNQYGTIEISNTKLRYYDMNAWGGATFIAFMKCSGWEGTGWGYNNVKNCSEGYTGAYTSNYTFNVNSLNLFTCEGTGQTLNVEYQSDYKNLNKKQSVEIWVSTDGGSTYTKQTTNLSSYGDVKATYYYLSAYNTTTQNSNQDIVANPHNAVITSAMSLNATAATGYTFKGYSTSSSSTPTTTDVSKPYTYTISGETTTRVYYALQSHNITYAINSDIANYSAQPTTGYYNNTITVTATASANHVITGASTNVDGVNPDFKSGQNEQTATITFTMPASDVQLTWTTALGKVNLNFGAGANGSLKAEIGETEQTTNTQIDGGSVVNFTATPNEYYEVEGWYSDSEFNTKIDDAGTDNTYSVTANADVSVYVKFKETLHNINIVAGTGIESTTPSDATNVGNVTPVGISAEVATGYTWNQWTLTGNVTTTGNVTDNPISVKATGTGTVTATATENMTTITVTSEDDTKGTVSPSNASVGVTTSSNISAIPQYGYKFKEWQVTNGDENVQITDAQAASTTVNGTGTASTSATIKAVFEEDLSTGWRLNIGVDKQGNWQQPAFVKRTGESTNKVAYASVELSGGTVYHFNYVTGTDTYKGPQSDGAEMSANTEWIFDYAQRAKFIAGVSGTYTFKIDYSDNDNPIASYETPSTSGIKGDWTDWAHEDGTVVDNVLTYQHTFGAGDIKNQAFKVVFNGVFYGAENAENNMTRQDCSDWTLTSTDGGNNIYLNVDMAGQYTFIYDKANNKLSVTYPGETMTDVTVYIDGETSSTVQVGEATHPTITAVQYVNGKRFAGWQAEDGVTLADASALSTQITKVIGTGKSVRATYNSDYMVYFKNTPGWGDVHVFFYTVDEHWKDNGTGVKYWDDNEDQKKWVQIATGHHMTRLNDKSDIWYYDYSGVSDVHGAIAFNDQEQYNYEYFASCQAAYRTDWDRGNNLSVFVPEKNISEKKNNNTAAYYNKGYWMKYDDLKTGYYLRVDGKSGDYEFAAASNGEPYKATITLEAGQTKEFWINGVNGSIYKNAGTMTSSGSHSGWEFYGGNQANCKITTTSEGTYTFTLTFGDGMLLVSVEYPLSQNDYRVVYTDNNHPCHPSTFIRKGNGNKDTVSFFIDRDKSPALKFQYCSNISGSTVTWADVDDGTINISDITATGIYNFNLEQTSTGISCTGHELYEGNFYIRTNAAAGGWDAYKGSADNLLPYIEYGLDESQPFKFTHAYTNWVEKDKNVKFCIANDYSLCISDTLVGDIIIGTGDNADWLKNGANIRFMWNKNTNEVKRAYISGSTNDQDRFLMLINTNKKMYNIPAESETPVQIDELKFTDKNNWVYQADIKAQPGCAVKLTAQYTIGDNAHIQYFMGSSESTTRTIISGSATDKQYTMRVVYDFKTNRLTAGWVPDNQQIDSEIKLGGDMLITREHQGDAQQITFGTGGQISEIHHVYGVLTLKKNIMTNANTMSTDASTGKYYENNLYWISFPFDVKISEIFGVDGYGTKWILQRYRGDLRAQKGWFAETPTFWEYMSKSETMNAYEGYVLCLDPNYFNPKDAAVWDNNAEEANFYFPSANGTIGIVHADSYTQPVLKHECTINRTFDAAEHTGLNHMNTDSHWNVIGVPAFQNATGSVVPAEGNKDFKSFYEWNPKTNGYTVKATVEDHDDQYEFKTMHAYMVQFYGGITWTNVSMVNKSVAPRRLEETAHYMAEIEFHQGNKANDHTYINLADNATTDFVLNEDMMKIDNAGCPNIYSFAGNYNVAYNETSKASQTIDLGVSAPAAGNYKFHMPSDFTGTVTLIDNVEQTRTDLQVQDYELYLDKGTYNDRFQLEINLQSVVTNLDNVFGGQVDSDHAVKFIRDDKMFILRSGSIFDATGKRMK